MTTHDTTLAGAPAGTIPVEQSAHHLRAMALSWRRAALGAILLGAATLNVWGLDREGYANTYYAAAVKSMLTSWHNFFFASFDGGGFVAVDKPPLGLWVQAASAKLFGFSGLSILAPEALAGVLSVALLYHLVARAWGGAAGLLAALALALTPVSVVVDRNNTIDSLLILTLLLAAWAATRAAATGKLRLLLLCAVLVGLGFNIKMLQAYLVVPAFALMYLLGAPIRWRARLGGLALAGVLLLVVSLSWSVAVDLTPASARPYVSDSGTNSELSLALGYNGLGRVTTTLMGGLHGLRILGSAIDLDVAPAFAPEIGDPSPWRLFGGAVGGQASWLLPLAALGLVVAALGARGRGRPRLPLGPRGRALMLWGGWLVAAVAFFSLSRFFHLYYLAMLAPPVAALTGVGAAALWRAYRGPGWRGWALPVTLVGAAAVQAHILADYPDWSGWLVPFAVGATLVAAALLAAARLRVAVQVSPDTLLRVGPRAALGATALGLAGLFAAPAAWAAVSVTNGAGGAWLPQAGPATTASFGGGNRASFARWRQFAPTNGGQGGAVPSGGPRPSFGAPPAGPGQGGAAPGQGQGNPSPFAGGSRRGGFAFGDRGGGGGGALTFSGAQVNASALDQGLVRYLQAHQGTARFLVATTTSSYASLFILATNRPAMALGGYQGWDRIVTPAGLATVVAAGTVRYFYLLAQRTGASVPARQRGGVGINPARTSRGPATGASLDATGALTQWVYAHCAAVPSSHWQTGTSSSNRGGQAGGAAGFGRGGQQLYDCAAT